MKNYLSKMWTKKNGTQLAKEYEAFMRRRTHGEICLLIMCAVIALRDKDYLKENKPIPEPRRSE